MISRFVLTQELSEYVAVHQSANLQANFGLERILSNLFFPQNCSKIVYVNDPCQLPSVNFDMSLHPAVKHTYE